MKASLAVCILAALLAAGSCLQCEICDAQQNNCTGPVMTCSPGEDTCSILLMEIMEVGVKSQSIQKHCATSSKCKTGPNSMNLGKRLTIRMSSACCVGEACRTATVIVPPAVTKPNGWHCPGCYALPFEQCQEETVDCTGAETHCIDVAATVQPGENPTKVIMKGCASESVCTLLNVSSGAFVGISENPTTVECRAASSAGGVAPGAARLLLPALAGLLLLKLLS